MEQEPVEKKVKRLRIENLLTQGELAKKAGVSKSTIEKIEGGKTSPTELTIAKIMRVLEK